MWLLVTFSLWCFDVDKKITGEVNYIVSLLVKYIV